MLDAFDDVRDRIWEGRGGCGEIGIPPAPSTGVPLGDKLGESLGDDGWDVLAGGPDQDTHRERYPVIGEAMCKKMGCKCSRTKNQSAMCYLG